MTVFVGLLGFDGVVDVDHLKEYLTQFYGTHTPKIRRGDSYADSRVKYKIEYKVRIGAFPLRRARNVSHFVCTP